MSIECLNMNKIEKFEDLITWQKARELKKNIWSYFRWAICKGLWPSRSDPSGGFVSYVKHLRGI